MSEPPAAPQPPAGPATGSTPLAATSSMPLVSPEPPSPPVSPWAAGEAVARQAPPAEATETYGLEALGQGSLGAQRHARRWADAMATIGLLVCAGAVLAAASPALGRAFTPDPPVAARRGVAQAMRLRGLQAGSLQDGLPSAGREPELGVEPPGMAPAEDPLGGAGRIAPGLESLGKWRGDGLALPGGADPDRRAQGEDEAAPRYRLGVASSSAVVRERPERGAEVLAEIAAGDVLLVAAAVEGWLYVALATDRGTVVGWVPRSDVVLP